MLAETSVRKSKMSLSQMIILGLLAGVYVAFGGILSIFISTGTSQELGQGVARFMAGSVFSLGLIMVILGGAELFTGNNLMVIGLLSRRVKLRSMLYNWGIVYAANFAGSLLVVGLVWASGLMLLDNGQIGVATAAIAKAKVDLDFTTAIVRGIGANWLVCVAVWLAAGGKSNLDRILGIYFPIMAFVALSLEHSVANMFLIPMGMVAARDSKVVTLLGELGLANLTWSSYLFNNLLPVTIGNIIGGSVLVGAAYWYAYRYPPRLSVEHGEEREKQAA